MTCSRRDQREIDTLGCFACPDGYIADHGPVTRECSLDPRGR